MKRARKVVRCSTVFATVACLHYATDAQAQQPAPPLPVREAPAAPAPTAEPKDGGTGKPPFRKKTGFLLALEGNRRSFFSIPFWGVGGAFGLALRPSESFAIDIIGEHLRGQSDNGLPAYLTGLRVAPQAVVTPWLRVGGFIGPRYLSLERATTHSSIQRLGLTLGPELNLDVIPGEDVSLFIGARGEIEFFWGNSVQLGGTGAIGIRL